MPTYNYKCDSCDFEFETMHSMSADPLTDCPNCNKPELVKLIGPGLTPIIKGTENPCKGRPKPKDKLGQGKYKFPIPLWREGKVNKKILDNPKRYIEEGKVG